MRRFTAHTPSWIKSYEERMSSSQSSSGEGRETKRQSLQMEINTNSDCSCGNIQTMAICFKRSVNLDNITPIMT